MGWPRRSALPTSTRRRSKCAAAASRTTGSTDRVAIYHSDDLKSIPAAEQWDLVVGNPPHFLDEGDLCRRDPAWSIHRGFYANVEKHLKPGGVICLQENNRGSTAETFRAMIEQAGLRIIFVDHCAPERTPHDAFYYVGVMPAGETPPSWARPQGAAAPPAGFR